MILAHLSDLHLGHRAYDRVDRGWNVRELDVAAAFNNAVQELIKIGPQVILMAGDIFDRPDPPPGALVALSRGLEAINSALPDTRILMVAGARDTPSHHTDPGALAALDTFTHVDAATVTSRPVYLKELDIHAVLAPHRAVVGETILAIEPDPKARWNVLLTYAAVSGKGMPRLNIDPGSWDYVALGHEHFHREVAPGVYYSGSLERVGSHPWKEAGQEKGFLTFDLETRTSTFHPVAGRPVVALAPIKAPRGDPSLTVDRIREVTDEVPGGIEGKIVQLTVQGISPADLEAVDGDLLSRLRKEALHLSVSVIPHAGAPVGQDAAAGEEETDTAPGSEEAIRLRLRDLLSERGEDPDELMELATTYLEGRDLAAEPGDEEGTDSASAEEASDAAPDSSEARS